jgi:hypothetical protein
MSIEKKFSKSKLEFMRLPWACPQQKNAIFGYFEREVIEDRIFFWGRYVAQLVSLGPSGYRAVARHCCTSLTQEIHKSWLIFCVFSATFIERPV